MCVLNLSFPCNSLQHLSYLRLVSIYRQKLNHEFSQQFLTLFQQWDVDVQKAEEQEEKLAVGFQHVICFTVFSQGGNTVV